MFFFYFLFFNIPDLNRSPLFPLFISSGNRTPKKEKKRTILFVCAGKLACPFRGTRGTRGTFLSHRAVRRAVASTSIQFLLLNLIFMRGVIFFMCQGERKKKRVVKNSSE